jgi:hypothetical protein
MKRRKHRTSAAIRWRPFTEAEDKELKALATVGLSVDYWKAAIPDRQLGELLERRLQLREAGELELARPI